MHQPAFNHCIVTDLPATLSLDNGQIVDGTAFNLSRSGVLVRTQTPCPPAKSGTLRLKTGSNRYLDLPVTLVHPGNRLVGLMLSALDNASSAEIERLLSAKSLDEVSGQSGLHPPQYLKQRQSAPACAPERETPKT